jgi:hypothetical protein
MPDGVREAATRAGRNHKAPDMHLLERVWDALARLPDSALGPYYYQIPGDCLASPSSRPVAPVRRESARAANETAS